MNAPLEGRGSTHRAPRSLACGLPGSPAAARPANKGGKGLQGVGLGTKPFIVTQTRRYVPPSRELALLLSTATL